MTGIDIAASPARSAWHPRVSDALSRVVAGVVILVLWEATVRLFAPPFVAKPTGVVLAIPRVIVDPAFLQAAGITVAAVGWGLLISILAGTLIGLLLGRSSLADRLLRQYVNFFNAMPMVVVLPLVSLWFGYTSGARLATIVFAAIFSIILNTADGARTVPREHLEVASSFRSRKLRTVLEVILPAATPYVLAGLRLAAGRALIGAVVAEFFLAIGGLGYYILYNSRTFHHDDAFVGVLLLAAFGLAFELIVNASTRRFLPWYRPRQATE
ncbi:MAG TPA: ABC transporter permease [Xanthobacteraceae bacterium]|jgi:ABC-type nitrate/sulfonate/bicarbonate transport system permease component